ncbi:MAG: hypothetical protein AAGH65_00240, partial [Pseudomonadota bacterium]
MAYDIEPNDALHEAVDLSTPAVRDSIQVIGELSGSDQDAYRLVVDEDMAGRRFNLSLTGRGGALTKLDIFDVTEQVDGRGHIPVALTARPELLASLNSQDGQRPVQLNALLLSPGVYILGISHSGGQGAYSFELSGHDEARVTVLDTIEPHALSQRGRTSTWTAGHQTYTFAINQEQAQSAWDLWFQTPLGHATQWQLLNANGEVLLAEQAATGVPHYRRGLQLAAGDYRIEMDAERAGVRLFSLQPGAAAPVDGAEVEPNDRTPSPIEFGQAVTGRMEGTDVDQFTFSVGAEQVARLFDLAVTADPAAEIELCLRALSVQQDYCRRGSAGATRLQDLALVEGDYQLSLADRKRAGTDWALSWEARGEVQAGQEAEPNDRYEYAIALHERGFGRGRFDNFETDYWRFSVSGEPQLWRVQLQGDDLHEVTLSNADNQRIDSQRAGTNTRVRLDNQFLMPGDYLIAVTGTDADYTVRLQPLGPPPAGLELEPNNTVASARTMRFGQRYTGTLAEAGDRDVYRIALRGPERIRVRVQPPVDGSLQGSIGVGDEAVSISEIRNQNRIGEPLEWDLSLPPGDYALTLSPGTVSDAEYQVEFERLDWLDAPVDREPNQFPAQAVELPANGRVVGRVGATHSQRDWYRLPVLAQPTVLEVPQISGLRFNLSTDSVPAGLRFEQDRASQVQRIELPAGEHSWLSISGRGDYALDLSNLVPATSDQTVSTNLPEWVNLDEQIQLRIELSTHRIQAFSPWAQGIEGTAIIDVNSTTLNQPLDLNVHLTHSGWSIQGLPERVDWPSESTLRLPFELIVPADVPLLPTMQLSMQLQTSDGLQRTAAHSIEVTAGLDDAVVNPVWYWSLNEALRGGFNAAATRFGSVPVDSPGLEQKHVEAMPILFDGMARYGRWTGYEIPTGHNGRDQWGRPTVQLAGDAPVPVQGFLINPTSVMATQSMLKGFEVALSMDGVSFETVLRGTLEPSGREQSFVLDQPVMARYARLIPVSANLRDVAHAPLYLGEFKVVAQADWRPQDGLLNLADPAMGGHLVWAEPWNREGIYDTRFLVVDDAPTTLSEGRAVEQVQLVLGFEHLRVARIDSVALQSPAKIDDSIRPQRVRLSASRHSPTGPWESLGQVDWQADQINFRFESPVWARYLRLTFDLDEPTRSIELPDRIAVYEAPGNSILGEWGHLHHAGPFEASEPPSMAAMTGTPSNDARARARLLSAGQAVEGRALLDQYASWYRFTVPVTDNQVELTMTGRPTLEGMPRLLDADQQSVDLYRVESDAVRSTWQAWVEPGADYWLEVVEPPRSVIFSWDTSGSVSNWLPTIFSALIRYAESIVPGRDEVNLMPFGYRRPLLDQWVGQS